MDVLHALIGQSLALNQKSEEIIANNLANAETPGFTASRLSFQTSLQKAKAAGASQVTAVQGTVVPEPGKKSANGNNVSITDEMTALARVQLSYQMAVAAMNHETTQIKIVTEGKAQ